MHSKISRKTYLFDKLGSRIKRLARYEGQSAIMKPDALVR
jgi:hypothetical protein